MAQGPQQPTQDGRRRDTTTTAPFAFLALPPRARGAGASNPNPVSCAIAELQDDLDLPATARSTSTTPATATATATTTTMSPRPAFEEPTTHPGERERADASQLAQRRTLLYPPHSPSDPPTPEGLGPTERPRHTSDAPDPSPGIVAEVEAAPTPTPVPTVGRQPFSAPSPWSVPSRPSDPIPQTPPPPKIGRLLVTVVVALASGMIGAQAVVSIHGLSRPPSNAPRPVTVPAKDEPRAPSNAERKAVEATAAIDALKPRIGQLIEQIDGLGARVGRIESAKPAPPAELHDLRDEVGRLSEATGGLAPLPGDVRRLDVRVANLTALLNTLRDEVSALRLKAEKATASPRTDDDSTPATAEARALAQGIKLFKQDRYREAIGVFNRLELITPDDARVWYFAALSQGLATGQWRGETERLVERGIACERAGSPGLPAINAAVSDLTPSQGRDWLAEYRRRIPSKPAGPPASPAPAAGSPPGRLPN